MQAYICSRVSASFTGRPTALEAATAIQTCGQASPLLPNAPPTKGDSTRTFSVFSPNRSHSISRTPNTYCEASCTVSLSPSQAAVVACGSSGLWFSRGVE